MRLPFVTRRAFDALSEHLGAQRHAHERVVDKLLANAKVDADRAEQRYADLMASYRMLKLQGYVETPPPRVATQPRELDPVEAAIRLACVGRDASVYKAMRARAMVAKATGMSDAEIIANIQRGSRPAEELEHA